CQHGCNAIEDMHHLFIECKHYDEWRMGTMERIMERTGEAIHHYLTKDGLENSCSISQRQLIYGLSHDWHIKVIQLAGRIWGNVQREMARLN
ncbi:hypothetical protein L208DRAFT_1108744, partial [Tricholoma matsutake]